MNEDYCLVSEFASFLWVRYCGQHSGQYSTLSHHNLGKHFPLISILLISNAQIILVMASKKMLKQWKQYFSTFLCGDYSAVWETTSLLISLTSIGCADTITLFGWRRNFQRGQFLMHLKRNAGSRGARKKVLRQAGIWHTINYPYAQLIKYVNKLKVYINKFIILNACILKVFHVSQNKMQI